jgi:microcystin-dependent protein
VAETLTPHFGWTKPDLGGDAATWGTVLNSTIDAIDAVAWNNQTNISSGGVPIGAVLDFFGTIIPTNYLPCDGSSHNVSDYPTLGAMLAVGAASTFNTPNYGGATGIGSNATYTLGATGGATTVTLDATMIPAHTHTASQAAHTHPGSYQDAHNHVITTGSHAHAVTTGSHSHTVTGGNVVASGSGLTPGGSAFSLAGGTTNTVGNLGGNTDTVGNLGGSTDARQPAVHIDTQQPAITVNATGGGAAHSNMSPYVVCNKIIRAK